MLNWYLVYTKPKNEDIVSQKFTDSGFEVINPKLKERKIYRRKLQDIISPLFPCYIFVKFDVETNFRFVKYTRGVKNIIGSTSLPIPVHESIIAIIKDRMEEGVVVVQPLELKPGEEVIIKTGPLEGFGAVFEKNMKAADRVTILLGAINARVVIDRAMIEKRHRE